MTEAQSSKTVLFAEIYKLINDDFVIYANSVTQIMIPIHLIKI
jgi:hypothetical protein